MLKPGDPAPPFRLPSTEGRDLSLGDFAGKRLVLYFYPKDETPGCTAEACDFRDNMARVKATGTEVLGVSKDTVVSHEKFREHHKLPFALLADTDNSVAKAYGAYGQKLMYGKPVVGTIRSTFLIDGNGKIAMVWSPVKVAGHVDQVLSALQGAAHLASTSPAAAAKPWEKPGMSKGFSRGGPPVAKRMPPRGRGGRRSG